MKQAKRLDTGELSRWLVCTGQHAQHHNKTVGMGTGTANSASHVRTSYARIRVCVLFIHPIDIYSTVHLLVGALAGGHTHTTSYINFHLSYSAVLVKLFITRRVQPCLFDIKFHTMTRYSAVLAKIFITKKVQPSLHVKDSRRRKSKTDRQSHAKLPLHLVDIYKPPQPLEQAILKRTNQCDAGYFTVARRNTQNLLPDEMDCESLVYIPTTESSE